MCDTGRGRRNVRLPKIRPCQNLVLDLVLASGGRRLLVCRRLADGSMCYGRRRRVMRENSEYRFRLRQIPRLILSSFDKIWRRFRLLSAGGFSAWNVHHWPIGIGSPKWGRPESQRKNVITHSHILVVNQTLSVNNKFRKHAILTFPSH